MLQYYTEIETTRKQVDPLYRRLYNRYCTKYGKCFVSDSIIIDDVLLSFLAKKYSLLNFEYDSILVTFHNFTRYFLCYQYVFIFTNGEAYLKTIYCNNYLMNIDTSTREILVKHVYDFFINKNKPIIINKKIRDKNEWYESDFPSIKIECYKKRKRVLLSYTNLEDGRYDLTFSKDFIIFRDLILIMVKEYDKRISNR